LKKCELLAPAGSYEAFVAAIKAGADAVYLGTGSHNARIGAKNFTENELERAIGEARLYNRKVYITLNTLVSDREMGDVLSSVKTLLQMGADAFIVQDLGLISAIKEAFPCAEIHASTQCVTHSLEQIKALETLGVKRVVLSRELDRDNIRHICRTSNLEIEVFVHGALCVSHSGGCLFSSLVGGRSGNRGECAQPCRLPYTVKNLDNKYPLSLRDLTLSEHVEELLEMGVNSLKIEGRMKSPDYVSGVVSVFRRLLDEKRNATPQEVTELEKIFSRQGFTDGYFKKRLGRDMFGVRRDLDKERTREIESVTPTLPKIPLQAKLEVLKDGGSLSFEREGYFAKVSLPAPSPAEKLALDYNSAYEQVSKLGATPFEIETFNFFADGEYFYPKSVLNGARREVAEKLYKNITKREENVNQNPLKPILPEMSEKNENVLIFAPHRKVTNEEISSLLSLDIQRIYLPAFRFPEKIKNIGQIGLVLPTILFDSQREEFEKELVRLKKLGVKYAYTENLGVGKIAIEKGFITLAGPRMNAYNSRTVKVLKDMGFSGAILSHEMHPSARRDTVKSMPTGEFIYGRAPLMTMENCVMNIKDSCQDKCDWHTCQKGLTLHDRKGIDFPVFPEFFHRCQIYNSVPTFIADKESFVNYRAILITDEKNVFDTVKKVLNGILPERYTRKG